jgi:hypothetical protein
VPAERETGNVLGTRSASLRRVLSPPHPLSIAD